jgi:FMN phosphatase YigB (HAD superfamily)
MGQAMASAEPGLPRRPTVFEWYGLDFGETVMNPFTLHQSALIREVYRELGKEGEAEEHVGRWYALRDEVGSRFEKLDLRVREVKQYARDRVYSEVLDSDPEAVRLFDEGEARGFSAAKGLEPALARLRDRGAVVSIVSESTRVEAALAIVRFIGAHSLGGYIADVITPAGRFGPGGGPEGREFVGKTKRDGSIYKALMAHLQARGVQAGAAVMVGDDPELDVRNSKEWGFVTVQYTGIVDRGRSPAADYVIDAWSELPSER